ncbi:MAG: cell division protein FtsA [Candidatus Taylorbacteria bacterium RIFCSPHIGHO2_02_FULL_45_28]|uniref:Cell division protein FtsA n=1 Tax=Candidatus Taylorbacteria bacterium RIFCSPHIGHO2_12_FULL_45_16 TaxID=1802315 RepID=A0A1G2MZ72_9BACT|nr:MAG: cell division protein FtsA [Candidatus Taylorbacteria bacterium RIFCSPHIGHO2_01_FULL_44_110]OHA25473.1 MAG: cell division protein FtsA [Candidatus Taylorbacteria bacterium RIFCSPHIGHO2_02_FULL_45_28]OHA29140.1 MAG: cell division protein FtsA [Candidatus Taylorbacteria bacterium RIFCSPHIGHO2_12_FULL_45_16]OHA33362.1 MAG: cell division protein FtsA [Candidatus Taylorbacteria bacterium RIFCSPLOWO2_01_FULL_45_59]OHA44634.1 MAG: cell division protein FtsA [Candidatus Taylorbacteria bacterium
MSRNIITGIDIGTYHVKVVIASTKEKTERGLPKIIGVGVADSRGVRHGYVTNVRDVADSIRGAVAVAEEKAGVKIKKAFVGVGGIGLNATAVTSSIITSRADAEITEIDLVKLREQCEKDLPQSAKANRRIIYEIPVQYKIDNFPSLGAPLGMTANKIEQKTLYITCLEHHVADLIAAVNEAGIEVEDIMAAPIAAGFVTLTKAQKIAGCILANIGAETVSIAVFENNIPASLEVFPIGSTDITNDIALGLKIPLEEAEQIKIGAITGASYPRKKLEEIISARLYDIFELIEAHLKKMGRNGLLPAGIIITGGGSTLNSIDDLAKAALKLPSRIGSMGLIDGKSSFKDNPISVAYGLCIWGVHTDESPEIDITADFFKNLWKKLNRTIKQFLP